MEALGAILSELRPLTRFWKGSAWAALLLGRACCSWWWLVLLVRASSVSRVNFRVVGAFLIYCPVKVTRLISEEPVPNTRVYKQKARTNETSYESLEPKNPHRSETPGLLTMVVSVVVVGPHSEKEYYTFFSLSVSDDTDDDSIIIIVWA